MIFKLFSQKSNNIKHLIPVKYCTFQYKISHKNGVYKSLNK